eukprot:5099028-Amphidinium_carterae.2
MKGYRRRARTLIACLRFADPRQWLCSSDEPARKTTAAAAGMSPEALLQDTLPRSVVDLSTRPFVLRFNAAIPLHERFR